MALVGTGLAIGVWSPGLLRVLIESIKLLKLLFK